jgi:RNA polymerase sigma-70 factor, ECF subfamily
MGTFRETRSFGFAGHLMDSPPPIPPTCHAVYEQNRQRIYALAFWLTDNEPAAEDLMIRTFCRGFRTSSAPAPEDLDCALIAEARISVPLGVLTLDCEPSEKVPSLRRNVLRIDLERALMQLPHTEKIIFVMHDVENYDHDRIARIMGLTQDQSRCGLHQARLRLRQLLSPAESMAADSRSAWRSEIPRIPQRVPKAVLGQNG